MEKQITVIVAKNLNLDAALIEDGTLHVEFNVTPEWDSLAHLSIMTDIEDEFDLEIDIDEMESLTTISKIKAFLTA
ncbi:hypothetical protein LSUCC1028_03915 [Rhodobacterales bacterium LSUCC1028]|nr:hypothetical protein [Rhodobacterales bacterium LSUCC1028]